jgi:GTP diphosphokinase / guanosine-3',5'-bis(diphosphate) 3'-diphosphatase
VIHREFLPYRVIREQSVQRTSDDNQGRTATRLFSELLEKLRGYDQHADTHVLRRAYLQASKWHAGQRRVNGDPYIIHPLHVALILADWHMGVSTLAAALLHDTVEDMLNPAGAAEMVLEYQRELRRVIGKAVPRLQIDDLFLQIVNRLKKEDQRSHVSPNTFRKSSELINTIRERILGAPGLSVDQKNQVKAIIDLLRDVTEDRDSRLEKIYMKFNDEIGDIVKAVTKVSETEERSRIERQVDYYRILFLAMISDLRVLLLKFADRLHNMRTLGHLTEDRRNRIALESLEVYAPLAHRFGMAAVRRELEDTAFMYLVPDEHQRVGELVKGKEPLLHGYNERFCKPLSQKLREAGIPAEVTGRIKHYYSIFEKMRRRNRSFEEIYDLLALRVIIDGDDSQKCYEALGLLHKEFIPLPGRFKDYIANPKSNGYRSLHTTLKLDKGVVFEVQIRTGDMHEVAEIGIARHWVYKEGRSTPQIDEQTEQIWEFLQQMENEPDPQQFLSELKLNLFPDDVFPVSPRGDIQRLSRSATVLDFAFAIHTELGFHCYAGEVNGQFVTLDREVKSGDTVHILTQTSQKPSRDWLSIVKTSKAKNRIRRWLREHEYPLNRDVGKGLLDRMLRRHRFRLTDEEWAVLATAFNQSDRDHLYAAVGAGDVATTGVMDHLRQTRQEEAPPGPISREVDDPDVGEVIDLSGLDGTMAHAAVCCNPIPGDRIVGYITRGRGLSIHRSDCPNVASLKVEPERFVQVKWDATNDHPLTGGFKASIVVDSEDRLGQLGKLSNTISNMGINIVSADANTVPGGGRFAFTVQVRTTEELDLVIERLRAAPGAVRVERRVGKEQDQHNTPGL